jgi:hypothetical protein
MSNAEQRIMRDWHRPVWLGLSVGHASGTVGSIGPFITFADDGAPGFLSLAFVVAPKGAEVDDYLHQPGPRDVELLTGKTRFAKLKNIAAARPDRESDTDCASAIYRWQGRGSKYHTNWLPRRRPTDRWYCAARRDQTGRCCRVYWAHQRIFRR